MSVALILANPKAKKETKAKQILANPKGEKSRPSPISKQKISSFKSYPKISDGCAVGSAHFKCH